MPSPHDCVPISAVLFEIGRLASKVPLADAMPNTVGLIWLAEHGYVSRQELTDDGHELLASLGQVLGKFS